MIYSSELIKGTLKTIILKLLRDNPRMYGYEMTQLEADGILQTESEFIGKRVRKYYSLTPKGKTKGEEKISELADFLETMKFLIGMNTQLIN